MINKTILLHRPSTFAQAAKLRRSAAAKEKELANCEATSFFSHWLMFFHRIGLYEFDSLNNLLGVFWISFNFCAN